MIALFIWTIQDVCGIMALLGLLAFILFLCIAEHFDR